MRHMLYQFPHGMNQATETAEGQNLALMNLKENPIFGLLSCNLLILLEENEGVIFPCPKHYSFFFVLPSSFARNFQSIHKGSFMMLLCELAQRWSQPNSVLFYNTFQCKGTLMKGQDQAVKA